MGGFKKQGLNNPSFGIWRNDDDYTHSSRPKRVNLRDIYVCKQCKKKFLSLYRIEKCSHHMGETEWTF